MDAWQHMLEGFHGGDVCALKGSGEPQMVGFVVMQANEMRRRWVMVKSPLGTPRLRCTTSSCLHTCLMIARVSVSTPRMRSEKRARIQALAHLSVGLSRRKTASRLVRVTKPLRSIFKKDCLIHLMLMPCWRPGWRQSARVEKTVTFLFYHGIVVACCIVQWDAFPWFATAADSCCGGAGEDTPLMEVEMLVWNVELINQKISPLRVLMVLVVNSLM